MAEVDQGDMAVLGRGAAGGKKEGWIDARPLTIKNRRERMTEGINEESTNVRMKGLGYREAINVLQHSHTRKDLGKINDKRNEAD
ncbi:unnamed protein product [Acanthocheilonema viteae]|uniref:Uncharacterized protein n=1 Tax=Acanthocheilonema viteae TaxID=6277 RepID=A0A498S4T8_ACAVI|nr:unnamed protein product [Acanthocheilonema viteae]